jgi:hypothetical protein
LPGPGGKPAKPLKLKPPKGVPGPGVKPPKAGKAAKPLKKK